MAESTNKYPNPPIQEAVCEVPFELTEPSADWVLLSRDALLNTSPLTC